MTYMTKMKKAVIGNPIYLVLVLLFIIMTLVTDNFLTTTNLFNVLVTESCRGILALGAGFVIISSGIDLSVGSVVALSAVITCSLAQVADYESKLLPNVGEVPLVIAILAGIAAGAAVGLFNGVMIAVFKVPPFIATLGTMTAASGIALTYTNSYPIPMLRPEYTKIGQGRIGEFPVIILYFVLVAAALWVILNKTRFGKSIYAIGGNKSAAQVAGVNVRGVLIAVYVVSGIISAIAGILLASRTGSAIASLGEGYEMDAISAAIVGGVSNTGGVGTVGGMIVGVLILGIVNNGLLLLGVSPYTQKIVKGLIIVAAVAFDMWRSTRKN